MADSFLRSSLVFSVIPPGDQLSLETERQVRQLLRHFEHRNLAAAWAIPVELFDAEHSSPGQELAILAEGASTGIVRRDEFSRRLVRRLTHAQSSGLPVSTIALGAASEIRNADLLVKHGLTMITGRRGTSRLDRSPAQVRWGLWNVPATTVIRNTNGWLSAIGGRSAFRQLLVTLRDHRIAHLQIQLDNTPVSRRDPLRGVDRILSQVLDFGAAGRLENKTLSALATELTYGPKSRSTQSILRRVA